MFLVLQFKDVGVLWHALALVVIGHIYLKMSGIWQYRPIKKKKNELLKALNSPLPSFYELSM
jgi:hypothetical protein